MTEHNVNVQFVLVHQVTPETLLHHASEANVKAIMNAVIIALVSTTRVLIHAEVSVEPVPFAKPRDILPFVLALLELPVMLSFPAVNQEVSQLPDIIAT